MACRSIPELALEEAADVLDALEDWLRVAPYCPNCLALPGCSHEDGCPLGRVARLRCLLGSGDQQRRDEALVALGRERGRLGTPGADGPLLAPLGTAVPPAHALSEVAVATPVHVEPGLPTVGKVSAT